MEPITITKTIFRRDTKTYEFILKRVGSPINLTSYTPYLSAKKKLDGTALFSKACTVTVAAEGRCQVTLSSVDTSITCKNAIAEIMIETAMGSQDTLGQFYIDIIKDVKTD